MKKIFKILSIGLMATMIITAFAGCGNKTGGDVPLVTPQIEGKTGEDLVKCMEVTAGDKTITVPFTISNLESLGFKLGTGNSADVKVEVDGLSSGNVVFKNETGDIIVALARNETGSETTLPNCTAFNVSTSSSNVMINGITCGKSTYADVLAKLGKDIDERADTFEAEKERISKESDDFFFLNLSYSYPVSENDETIIYSMICDIDADTGTVSNVTISKN